MQSIDIIQKSIDYIENNLKSDITIDELAEMANYSLYHYCRVFKSLTGLSVKCYINRRRLLYAAYEISQGRKIIDAALEYGFETNSGFYKAFVKEFGYSPSEYFTMHIASRPYKINLLSEEHIMITQNKLRKVLENWNLQDESISDCYHINTHKRSDNVWYVGDKYVIKVCTNEQGLKNNIAISKSLIDRGLVCAVNVKTNSNDDYFTDGELFFYVTERLNAQPIKSVDVYENIQLAEKIGEAVGRLDLILEEYELICNEPNLLNDIDKLLSKVKSIMNLDTGFCKELKDKMMSFYPNLRKQIIHRDTNLENILYDGDNLGFIDFDLTEKNIRIFDICYCATSILSETFDKREKWFDVYNALIKGYERIVDLTDAERNAIPYLIFSIQMICISYFISMEKYKALAEININILNWLIENKSRLFKN
ncbi:MAG: helix-turn-helix domain-containing protein [Eubacterium sp.]|nr:helix-turn-helix domain-containing protein [Eubacterium sp.]